VKLIVVNVSERQNSRNAGLYCGIRSNCLALKKNPALRYAADSVLQKL